MSLERARSLCGGGVMVALTLLCACPSPTVKRAPSPPQQAIPEAPPTPLGPPTARDPHAASMLRAASHLEADGDTIGARSVYVAVLTEHADTVEAAIAQVRLAEDAVARRDYPRARVLAARASLPEDEAGVEFTRRVTLGRAEEGLEAFDAAADAFASAIERAPEGPARTTVARDAVRTAALAGDVQRARELASSNLVAGGALRPSALTAMIVGLLDKRVSPSQLRRLYRTLPPTEPLWSWIALEYARSRCAVGELEPCQEAASGAAGAGGDPAWRGDASELLALISAWRQVRPRSVGVLLPLSGPYAEFGLAAKRSIELAFADHPGLEVTVADTAGDAEQAADEARRLILERHVGAIIGPIGKNESAAAVATSAAFGVPHVILSNRRLDGPRPPTVVRFRLGPVEQAEAIARYAATELDLRRVGILFPGTDNGQRLMGAFWDEVVRLGAEIYAVESYPARTRDFREVIGRLVAADKPGEGATDFDALFIADNARAVSRLLPFLKYWGLGVKRMPGRDEPGVQLLGASGWNHVSVIDRGENLADNAVFVDAYYHDPDDPDSDAFARRYFATYRERPRAFHAEVYDAAQVLAPAALSATGTDHGSRKRLLAVLTATRNHRGAVGLISVLGDGTVARRPRLLTVHGDEIRQRVSEEEERALRLNLVPVEPLEE